MLLFDDHSHLPSFLPSSPLATNLFSIPIILSFQTCYINGNSQYAAFWPKVLAMKNIQTGKKPTESSNFAPDFTFLAGITLFTVATSIQVWKQTLLLFPLTIAKKFLPLPKGI